MKYQIKHNISEDSKNNEYIPQHKPKYGLWWSNFYNYIDAYPLSIKIRYNTYIEAEKFIQRVCGKKIKEIKYTEVKCPVHIL